MNDIGFQSLSRMLAAGMDIKVIVLDTQVYSNTGGQTSTSSFKGQDAKMSFHGKVIQGKKENRKELANICMMHKDVYVAQTTCAHLNHFYKAVMDANEYPGPAVINVFTTCQPEHGVGDNMAEHQAKLAADSRSFPIFIYDPRKGSKIQGTPEPGRKSEHEGRLVRQSEDRRSPSTSSRLRVRKAASRSTSTKMATLSAASLHEPGTAGKLETPAGTGRS